ncbi:apolipoprotein N-acyltransferase [Calidifontibacter terrae]
MIRKLPLAVAGGLSLWLAFPGVALWFMAPIGIALISAATVGVRARTGFLLGLVGGLAFFLPVLHWTGIYVGALPWIALSITESLYLAFMGAAIAWVQRDGRIHPLWVACLWVLQETVRSNVPFGGFPWARLAWSTAGSPLMHLASIAGAPGLTFVVALLGAWLTCAVMTAIRAARTARLRVVRPLLATAAVVALASIYPVPTGGKKLDVVGIQGNVPTAGLEFNAQRRAVLDNHVAATNTATALIRQGRIAQPDLVVWPENSSDIDPTRNADAATEIARAVAAINAPTIVGAVLEEPAPDVSNASLLYLPGKGLVDRYVKQHPVPFAEYMPYRSFFRFFSDKVDLITTNFTHGKKVGVFSVTTRLGTIKVGPVICFEIAYDGITRAPVTRGAGLLIVQTNNATFGYTAESEQQLAISRVRAVEHGRSVVHVSTVGVSALITPDGALHNKSSLFTRKVLAGELPVRQSLTIADRVGAWPEYLVDALAIVALVLSGRHRTRTNPATPSPAPKETDARV